MPSELPLSIHPWVPWLIRKCAHTSYAITSLLLLFLVPPSFSSSSSHDTWFVICVHFVFPCAFLLFARFLFCLQTLALKVVHSSTKFSRDQSTTELLLTLLDLTTIGKTQGATPFLSLPHTKTNKQNQNTNTEKHERERCTFPGVYFMATSFAFETLWCVFWPVG